MPYHMSYISYKERTILAALFHSFCASLSSELTGTATAATDVQVGDTGVMVADLIIVVLPRVEVEVLVFGAFLDARADVHMIEGLGVHIEEVSVALLNRNVGDIVEVEEARDLLEGNEGLNLNKLVEVTGNDDTS